MYICDICKKSSRSAKYLKIVIDFNLIFKEHIEKYDKEITSKFVSMFYRLRF